MMLIFMRYVLNSVMSEQPDNLRAGLFKQKRLITRIEIGDFYKNYQIFINSYKVMRINAILLNPTIDQIYEIENFKVGHTFKVNKSTIYPVGKAISFSLAIRELDKEVNLKIIAFIGKEELELYSNFLRSKNIDFEFIAVNGKTRSNKTINDPIKKTTTHIRELGFELNENNINSFKTIFNKILVKNDFYVFCGSIPQNTKSTIYYDLIKICKEKGGICILDSSGPPLMYGLKGSPRIIKPNLTELSFILEDPLLEQLDFSEPIVACNQIVQKASSLLNDDLEIILITLGEKGGILLTKEIKKYGTLEIKDVIDTVGSGDSFLAGFIIKYFQKKDLNESFKYALATGAANTLRAGPGVLDFKTVEMLMNKVKIIDLF